MISHKVKGINDYTFDLNKCYAQMPIDKRTGNLVEWSDEVNSKLEK